jgi:hypothetical protein
VKVRFTDEDVNGLMDNEEGVLYIGKDLDADKTEVFVVGHELTHRMQNQSEAKGSGVYSAFKQVALDWAKAHQEEGGNGYDFSLIKGKYERFFRDKYKSEGLRMGMTDEQASAYAEKKVGEKVTDDYVNDEIAANVAGRMMMNPKVVEDMFRVRPADPEKARGWRRALEWLRDFLNERFERIMGKRPESLTAEDRRLVELRNKFNDMYTELVRDDLADQGVDTADNGEYSLKEEDKKLRQGFGSAATSLNQVASAFRKIKWNPGTTNVDIGGGRFDKATDYLKSRAWSQWCLTHSTVIRSTTRLLPSECVTRK